MRKLEIISKKQFDIDFKDYDTKYEDLIVPKRNTKYAAGYDFYLPFDIELNPGEIVKIPTGIKVMMNEDEFFGIYVRSSLGFKYNMRLCNQVGIIDYDYYNNIDNEGHMFIRLQNNGDKVISLKKGERYVQGIFQKYYIVDNEEEINAVRVGGLGSTNKGDDNNG